MLENYHSWIDFVENPLYKEMGVELSVLREDKIHPVISGNKWRKLKYNLEEARRLGHDTLLSFGGAFSNHIAALAEAAREHGFKSIGVIRGEELKVLNPTLERAQACGMQLHFVDRESYRRKAEPEFLNTLTKELGAFMMIPEGGSNDLGVKGCEEILFDQTEGFQVICSAVGTGATLAGLIKTAKEHQKVLGFPALKNTGFLEEDIAGFLGEGVPSSWELVSDYHFGGYAKVNDTLIAFINQFHEKHGIPLDPIYTGKMFFGIHEMITTGAFPAGTKILAVHTGGLQGIKGINKRLQHKGIRISYDETA